MSIWSNKLYFFLKRGVDIVFSILLIIIFSPVILFVSAIIKLESSGPVLADTPKRVGKNGKLFYPYKFRSMIVNAYQLLKTDPQFKKAYEEQYEINLE